MPSGLPASCSWCSYSVLARGREKGKVLPGTAACSTAMPAADPIMITMRAATTVMATPVEAIPEGLMLEEAMAAAGEMVAVEAAMVAAEGNRS